MDKFKKAELKLNEFPDPTHFHDMSVVNMVFSEDCIKIRFILAKYLDEFDILEDDNHFAVLEVNYNGVRINKMYLEGLVDFRCSDVYLLKEENGIISLNLHNDIIDCYFYIEFSFEDYKWSVHNVITIEEYYEYESLLQEHADKIKGIQEIEAPIWSKFYN